MRFYFDLSFDLLNLSVPCEKRILCKYLTLRAIFRSIRSGLVADWNWVSTLRLTILYSHTTDFSLQRARVFMVMTMNADSCHQELETVAKTCYRTFEVEQVQPGVAEMFLCNHANSIRRRRYQVHFSSKRSTNFCDPSSMYSLILA